MVKINPKELVIQGAINEEIAANRLAIKGERRGSVDEYSNRTGAPV